MSFFYIVSRKWTAEDDPFLTLWRPSNAGYTVFLFGAGRYGDRSVYAQEAYYNNGVSTFAVAESRLAPFFTDSPADWEDEQSIVVRNAPETWAAIEEFRTWLAEARS